MSSAIPAPKGRRDVKLAERLAHEIVMDITDNNLVPGDRLPSEVVMAQQRGVSRATLREALRILEAHGLITIRTGPGGGPQLGELTSGDFARMATLHFRMAGVTFRQILEARVVLEPRVAEMAALNRTPEQIVALRANVREHRRATTAADLAMLSRGFHTLVSDCASNENPVMSLMTSSLYGIFEIAARGYVSPAAMGTSAIHAEICDAIEDADPERASNLMEQHMRESINTFGVEHPTLVDSVVPWLTI
jgi:GntR family transcriptional repressor for pyruvate dehydrogenase complex